MKSSLTSGAMLAGLLLLSGAAQAATVSVSGSGKFDRYTTPSTNESAGGATFTFSFLSPDPYTGATDISIFDTTYTLNSALIVPTIVSAKFFTETNGGLFDLTFSDGNVLSFQGGPDIGSSGTLNSGNYFDVSVAACPLAVCGLSSTGKGAIFVSVDVSAVPLPSSAPLFGAAVLCLGAIGYGLKRKSNLQGYL